MDFVAFFPRDVFDECLQELDEEDGEYLSLVAFRAFPNNARDLEFAQSLQLGKNIVLPLFQEWMRELKAMLAAPAQSVEREDARASVTRLLNRTLPNVMEAIPEFYGIVEDAVNLKIPCDGGIQTALHVAAKSGDLDLFNNLLACGAKFDVNDDNGNTVLHVGVDHPGIVEALLSAAGSAEQLVQQINNTGQTALYLCNNAESARLLLRVCPSLLFDKDKYWRSALHCSINNPSMIEALLAATGNAQQLEQFLQRRDRVGGIAWHLCENAESARLLLRASPKLVFSKCMLGKTALHNSRNDSKMVKVLLSAIEDGQQLTRFVQQVDAFGQTPLHYCADVDCAQLLLEVSPGLTNTKCSVGYTPLHMHAMRNWEDMCRFLIVECGADVNAVSAKGHTPLHLACFARDVKVVRLLLGHSARAFARDALQRTALHFALIEKRHDGVVANTHISASFQQGMELLPVMGLLLEQDDEFITARDGNGRTALHYCALLVNHDMEAADRLLLAGADGNVQDNQGDAVMHAAARCSDDAVLHLVKQWALSLRLENHNDRIALDLVNNFQERIELERASVLAFAVTLRLAARSKPTRCAWKRLPRELFRELCWFLV